MIENTSSTMNFNKFTLAFSDEDERLFLKSYFRDSIFQFRIAFISVIILYGVFGFLDMQMIPEFSKTFHSIRYLFVIPIFSIVFILSFTKLFQKIWQFLLFLSSICGGIGISIMTILAPEVYAYNAGMMLVLFACYFFIKLRFIYATIAGWSILIIYNIIAIFFEQTPQVLIISNNFFFVSANLIGMLAAYNIEFFSRRNFFLSQKLDLEKQSVLNNNKNLEITVEERTKELLKAKEQAEESEVKFRTMFESMQEGVYLHEIIYDDHGKAINYRIIEANPVSEKYLNINPENAIGKLATELYELPEAPFLDIFSKVAETATPISFEQYFEPMGKHFLISVFSPQKGVFATVFLDITNNKNHEIELIAAKEKAEENERLKSAFLANMSHEIRTPMNGIIGFAELLKEPGLSGEKQKEYIQIIEKSGARMLNIINDIVDISKIEAGITKVNITDCNINNQLENIYKLFKPEVEAKGIEFSFNTSLPEKNAILKTDNDKLNAILSNLLKNAIKFTKTGKIEFGYIHVDTGHALYLQHALSLPEKSFIHFYVKDTGIGIPQNRQSAIFERFIQADISHKMAYQGAGLGLSISKSFIEMLGGTIWVESEEGIGSTFYFSLPYNGEIKEKISSETENSTQVKENQIKKLKILIAEDDETSEMLISLLVKKYSKELLKAKTGKEAVEICRTHTDIDLVLMDIQMPEMNGYEATQQIRKFNKDVIIIAQTAFGLLGDNVKAFEAGCNDYIKKPILKNALLLLIQKYFQ